MTKVYEFPTKVLQQDVEEYLYALGREYGARMNKALDELIDDYGLDLSKEEVFELVFYAYVNGVVDAMEEL
jgi:predicted hydrocarbon binding protein